MLRFIFPTGTVEIDCEEQKVLLARKIKIATSVLKEHALLWCNNLHADNKPRI